VLIRRDLYLRLFEEIVFLFAPLLAAFLLFFLYDPKKRDSYAKYVFWGITLAYLLSVREDIINVITELPAILSGVLITSSIQTESTLSYVFGLFALYFVLSGRKWYALLALACLLLSVKRLALFGVALGASTYFLINLLNIRIDKTKKYIPLIAVLANLEFVLLLIQFTHDSYDHLIRDFSGMSPNSFTNGRKVLYEEVLTEFGEISWSGVGLGKMTDFLKDGNFTLENLHSDVLKYYLELGSVLFVVWIYSLYSFNLYSKKLLIMALYLNVAFLAGNVSIYFHTMFIFYLLQGFLFSEAPFQPHPKRRLSVRTGDKTAMEAS
jgi:hypothetical protein